MAGNRFRYIDYWHFRYINADQQTSADEIINEPERHLLSQDALFAAEGGALGVAAQLGVIGLGFAVLFAARPKYLTYLRNAQLRSSEWAIFGATAFVTYRLGYQFGAQAFGDANKVNNHWLAYFYQKQLNRFEGRQILSKRPGNY